MKAAEEGGKNTGPSLTTTNVGAMVMAEFQSGRSSAQNQASRPVSIREAAQELGLAIETLRRWHASGRLNGAVFRSGGGHRRFDLTAIRRQLGLLTEEEKARESKVDDSGNKRIILVSRVSSQQQAATSIPQQKEELEAYANANFSAFKFEHFTRVASGLNFNSIMPLVDKVMSGGVSHVIATDHSRLLRLGNQLITQIFSLYDCSTHFIYDEEDTSSLEQDLLAIVGWYVNKLHFRRSPIVLAN